MSIITMYLFDIFNENLWSMIRTAAIYVLEIRQLKQVTENSLKCELETKNKVWLT